MSVEATSPTAVVNNAIMAAADEILAGLKGGNLFPSPLPAVTIRPYLTGEQKNEPHGSVSPTAVHHHDHTKIIAEEQADSRPHAESFVSHSSQVTFDSRDGGTDGAAAAMDMNKIASASSLTSSEVSHPDGDGCLATHQEQILQGPPMQQVTFPSGTGTSAAGASTYRGTGAKRTAYWPCGGTAEPRPLQKPRLSPAKGGSSCVPTRTAGTPVAEQQSELTGQQYSSPPPPTQAAGQLTFQPIQPAVVEQEVGSAVSPPAHAQVLRHQHQPQAQVSHQQTAQPRTHEPGNHHQESQQHQGQGGHRQTPHHQPQAHPESRDIIFTLGHHTYALGQDPGHQPAYNPTYTTFQMTDKRPELEVNVPVSLAPNPTELGSQGAAQHLYQQSMLAASHPHIVQTADSNVPSFLPPVDVNLSAQQQPMVAAGASPAPYPPIYPRPSIIQINHMTHQQHSHTAQSAAAPPGHGATGELAVSHSHPYTSSITTHAHHYQQGHSVNNHRHSATACHAPVTGEPGTTTAAPTTPSTGTLTKPAFPNQSHGSTTTTTVVWGQPNYGLDAVGYDHPAVNDPGQGSQDLAPNLRRQKMQPTDCLLFAASLLQEGPRRVAPAHPDTLLAHSSAWMEAGTATVATASQLCTIQGSTIEETALSSAAPVYPAAEVGLGAPVPAAQQDGPQDLDVLCGRGGLINKHVGTQLFGLSCFTSRNASVHHNPPFLVALFAGNIIYRKVCEYNKPFYQTVQKRHRILVSQSIVHTILKRGGRFLSEDTKTISNPDGTQTTFTVWKPVATVRAIQKTSQALRERLASRDKDSNGSQNGAAT
jgi:hypothetical protein